MKPDTVMDTLVLPLTRRDVQAYKSLRDHMLAAYPEAFTSDAAAERARSADSYAARIGGFDGEPAMLTLGAWCSDGLIGAISCERDARRKVRHIGHVVGMMVRAEASGQGIGRALLDACIAAARAAGLELLTLSVTSSNAGAIRLYTNRGFERYGTLRRAIKIGAGYHDKDLMSLSL